MINSFNKKEKKHKQLEKKCQELMEELATMEAGVEIIQVQGNMKGIVLKIMENQEKIMTIIIHLVTMENTQIQVQL